MPMSYLRELWERRPLRSADYTRISKHMELLGLDFEAYEDGAEYRAEARRAFRTAHQISDMSYSTRIYPELVAEFGPPQSRRQAARVYGPECYRWYSRTALPES